MKTPRFWQQKHALSTALLPLSAFYALGFALDKTLTKKERAPLPVIAVGNVTAGGAGKTPTAIALADMLRNMGENPHIITRGYGAKVRGVKRVTTDDTYATVGDEALLLARHAPTWVSPSRINAAHAAHEAGASVVIADDALQHHALAHDLLVLVVDLTTGLGNGRLLPAGPLRQTLASAHGKAPTFTIAIGDDDPHHLVPLLRVHGEVFRARIQPTCVRQSVDRPALSQRESSSSMDDGRATNISFLKEGKFLAFAGIAYPQKFYATLRALDANIVETVDFPDHHRFTAKDLQALQQRAAAQGLALITTEKDAVRLPAALATPVHTLPVTLQFEEPEALAAAWQAWRTGT